MRVAAQSHFQRTNGVTVVYDDIAIGNPAISLFLKHGLIEEYRKDEIITKYMDKIDELLQTPCWIIDILPAQVPAESAGQYFAVEKYFLKEQLAEIKQKHINVILKLNCYPPVLPSFKIWASS